VLCVAKFLSAGGYAPQVQEAQSVSGRMRDFARARSAPKNRSASDPRGEWCVEIQEVLHQHLGQVYWECSSLILKVMILKNKNKEYEKDFLSFFN
jgi:hypothetical protein